MHKLKRFTARLLMVIMLSFSITASMGRLSYTTVQAAVKAPTVTETTKTLYEGYNTYKITFKNKAAKSSITFKSSNTKVATVAKNGTVTPIKKGTAEITATVKQNSKTYKLTVTIIVEKPYISLTSSAGYLNIGEDFLFKAKLYGMKGKVTWSVTDEEVATINSGGKLTAKASGEVTVSADVGDVKVSQDVLIGSNRIGTYTKNLNIYKEQTIYIKISEPIEDEIFYVDTLSGTEDIVEFDWAKQEIDNLMPITVKPIKAGTDTLIFTSDASTDQLHINVTVVEEPADRVELESTEIFKKCNPSMVEITAVSSYGAKSLGSGFFIDNSSVITNYHVIEGAEKLTVKTYDNKEFVIKTILGYDENLDLAVLETDADYPGLVLSQDGVETGETVYALGSPFGLTGTLTNGMITTASRPWYGVDCIQSNAAISQGNSGGPLINMYGEVVGVNTMYLQDGQNLNFSINIKEMYKVNINKPVSIKEYHEWYEQMVQDTVDNNAIHEDTAVSQDPDICQKVPPYTKVIGTLNADESGDCYYIRVDSPIFLYGVITSENMEDMSVTYVQVYDYDYDKITNAYKNSEVPMQSFYDVYMEPGDYFIVLYLPNDYIGEDVPYSFMLGYEDVY